MTSLIENDLEYNAKKNKYLIITNAYPHDEDLYRNGFIHRRVKAYQAKGLDVEVFVLHGSFRSYEEYNFEGVPVSRGLKSDLYAALADEKYTKILIHFVSQDMIDAIMDSAQDTPIIIWIHGFEAEAWHRRWFNFMNSKEELKLILHKAKTYYEDQMKLMNWLYQTNELNLKFVHVSRWFKEHIAECDARAVSQNASIIPNIVDSELFSYEEKPEEQRFKILSIRPFASHKYANDQSVNAVLELSTRPYFDRLEFAFYGEGKLFEKTLFPLRRFDNVHLHKTFLKQDEIAKLHKDFGVFLCPTRLDSQGVSMCEAMSSGLVPISSNTTAIPEFVTHNESGLLAKPENPVDLADMIERLFFNSSLFNKLSKNAASNVREKCSQEVVINKELELILS